jgi:hypothetical protein
MNKLFTAALAVTITGCGFGNWGQQSSFKNGVPAADDVKLAMPGNSTTQPLEGEGTRKDGLLGEQADFYKVTRAVTVAVNGGTAVVLGLIGAITNETPTSTTQDTATWGPYTDSLSPNTWRLVVTKVATDKYTYALDGRGKNEADSAFRTVLSGTHNYMGKNLGKGTFLIDWDVAKTLPEHDNNVGKADFTYSRETASSEVSIEVAFHQVKDSETGALIDANYLYKKRPNAGGNFEFTAKKNLYGGAALESLSMNSRWQESGAGRSDVKAKGGDLPTDAIASECWDQNFLSVYLDVSYDSSKNYGAVSACNFQSAEYSALAP